MTKPNVIEMHDITKKFGEFVANQEMTRQTIQQKPILPRPVLANLR